MFLKQAGHSNYCAVYATAGLVELMGQPMDRAKALRLFGLERRNKHYRGTPRREIMNALERAGVAERGRWRTHARFDFDAVAATLARCLDRGQPTILTFGAIHAKWSARCRHVVTVLKVTSSRIRLLDPLGKKPASLKRGNVSISRRTDRGGRYLVTGSYYFVNPKAFVEILDARWTDSRRSREPMTNRTRSKAATFRSLTATPESVSRLLAESHYLSTNLALWTDERRFVAQAINREGAILDIGCANGFLLRCLQEWQPRRLIPYGIDHAPVLVDRARELFPREKRHFQTLAVDDIRKLREVGLPAEYPLVYWNVWDNWDFADGQRRRALAQVLGHVSPGGRLILGFYHPDQSQNLRNIAEIERCGLSPSGSLENPSGRTQAICWIDVPA